MNKYPAIFILILIGLPSLLFAIMERSMIMKTPDQNIKSDIIKLPPPQLDGRLSVEKALSQRRSVREYKNQPLSMDEISQLLWSAQGITDSRAGLRTSPSAGALYPMEIYLIAGNMDKLPAGIYKYNPKDHSIEKTGSGDYRDSLCQAALEQDSIRNAPVNIVITAVYQRTTWKYGERGIRYVHMEAGHIAQNIYLESESLNLGMVVIGAFQDQEVKKVLNLPKNEDPLYILPIGKK